MKEMTDEERKKLFEKKLKELIDFTEEINRFYQNSFYQSQRGEEE
mgnify:CR=1 FL=1